jgi:short-subunit dehydrogenase
MDLREKRFLVAGATGELGARLAAGLIDAGVRVGLAGRDVAALDRVASELGTPAAELELEDGAAIAGAVRTASEALGGLDGLVVATGAVAFGPAADLDDAVAARLMQVNALGPMALIGAALPVLARPGAVVALSAVVADHPTAGMAAYSASKAALSAYLAAVRREERRDGLLVLDVKPQHIETGFAERALAGSPPPLDAGADPDDIVTAILSALRDDRRELAYDLRQRTLLPT